MIGCKRILSLMVIVAIIALSGCNFSGKDSSKKPNSGQPEGNAVSEEKPVLKYLGRDVTFDLTNNPMIPIIEKATGYKVEYEALPAGEDGTMKLMSLISSGTPYDIVNVYPDQFDRILAANAIKPLDEMLKKAPNLIKAVPPDSESWRRVKGEDGKIYGIPQLRPNKGAVSTIAVRKDIIGSLNIHIPTTPEELYSALKIIKEKKPEMIPLTLDKTFIVPPVESGFNVYKDWYEINGQLVPNQKRTEYREYIEFMRKLYAEGLLDKEFPANDAATRLAKFTSGKTSMAYFGFWEGPGFYSALKKSIPDSEVSYLPFLKDKNGNKGVMSVGGLEKVCFIPKSAKHPQDAIAWIDAFMANFKEIYIGKEGQDHKVEDGKYLPIMPNFSVHDTVWWFMPAVDEANVFDWWQARVRKNPEVERGYMDTFALKTPDVNVVTPFFSMYPPNKEFIELGAKLDQYWLDEMIKIVTGAVPLSDYDKIVAKWETDGGTRYIQIANDMWKKYREK